MSILMRIRAAFSKLRLRRDSAAILVLVAVIASSFLVPWWLGSAAMEPDPSIGAMADTQSIAAFEDGYRQEREGNLERAIVSYRAAAASTLPAVRDPALSAAARISRKLESLGTLYDSVWTWQQLELRLRIPMLLVLLPLLVLWPLRRLKRRYGTELRRFTVIPEFEADAAIRFDRLLLEELVRIARSYRSDLLRRISAEVTISDPSLDRELGGFESRAIDAIRRGELKSVIGFWLAELLRRLQNVAFNPEHTVSGTVIVGVGELTGMAQLTDTGGHAIVAVYEASSRDAAEVRELPASPVPVVNAPIQVLAALDHREDVQRLSDLATVLACKIFMRWTQKLPPPMRPSSWQTIYHFAHAINALEEPPETGARRSRQMACAHLRRIAQLDPMYRPATFFLGVASLMEGETAEAERAFCSLVEIFNHNANLHLEVAKQKWAMTGIQDGLTQGQLKVLEPWIKQWMHVHSTLLGGRLYRIAKEWPSFPDRLVRFEAMRNGKGSEFRDREEASSFQDYLDVFNAMTEVGKFAQIAAGLSDDHGEIDRDRARRTLDVLLSSDKVADLDLKLFVAEMDVVTARVNSLIPDATDSTERPKPNFKALKQKGVVDLFRFDGPLDELDEAWNAGRWDRCASILQDLRDCTRAPSDAEAGALLRAGSPSDEVSKSPRARRRTERLVKKYLPGMSLLDAWRNTFRYGFFLESEYGLAACRYQTDSVEGLHKAMQQAAHLDAELLTGAVPQGIDAERYEDLGVLSQCLEVNAAVRIMRKMEYRPNAKETRDAWGRYFQLEKKIIPGLRDIAGDEKREPRIRAAVLCSLGLNERHKRKPLEVREKEHLEKGLPLPLGSAEKRTIELECFEKSLAFARSADACFYLAESLYEFGRGNEAKLLVDETLRICPGHAGASQLRQRL
jgi:hypothetical protein